MAREASVGQTPEKRNQIKMKISTEPVTRDVETGVGFLIICWMVLPATDLQYGHTGTR